MRPSQQRGFTLVELLVVIAILLPAVQAAREATRRIECSNNLKQIALALHSFEDVHKNIPSAHHRDEGVTWFVKILPFLEQQAIADCWDMRQLWHHPSHRPCWSHQVSAYRCPSRGRPSEFTPGSADSVPVLDGERHPPAPYGDYAGNGGTDICCCWPGVPLWPPGAFPGPTGPFTGYMQNNNGVILWQHWDTGSTGDAFKSNIKFASIRDGLSNTIFLGEKHVVEGRHGPSYKECNQNCEGLEGELGLGCDGSWVSGNERWHASRLAGMAYPLATGPQDDFGWPQLNIFGSWHPGICQFAMGDGGVRALNVTINGLLLEELASRNSSDAGGGGP